MTSHPVSHARHADRFNPAACGVCGPWGET